MTANTINAKINPKIENKKVPIGAGLKKNSISIPTKKLLCWATLAYLIATSIYRP